MRRIISPCDYYQLLFMHFDDLGITPEQRQKVMKVALYGPEYAGEPTRFSGEAWRQFSAMIMAIEALDDSDEITVKIRLAAQQCLAALKLDDTLSPEQLMQITVMQMKLVSSKPAPDADHISNSLRRFQRQFDSDTTPQRHAAAVGTGAAIPPPVFRVSSQRKCARTKARQLTQ